MILGISQSFPGGALWEFVPADYKFLDPSNPFTYPNAVTLSKVDGIVTQDFVGMKLGDVNHTLINNLSGRTASNQKVTFDILEEKVINDAEKIFEIPIRVMDFVALSAFQLTLSWDAEKMEFLKVSNSTLELSYGKQSVASGILTVIWDDSSGKYATRTNGSEIAIITFKSKGNSSSHDLSVVGNPTPVKIFDKNLDGVMYEVSYSKRDEEVFSSSINVYPNPFSDGMTVDFFSKEKNASELILLDMFGRVLKRLKINMVAGKNQVELGDLVLDPGVYILDLTIDSISNKVKVIKH
jgi:hypothetical protein